MLEGAGEEEPLVVPVVPVAGVQDKILD